MIIYESYTGKLNNLKNNNKKLPTYLLTFFRAIRQLESQLYFFLAQSDLTVGLYR